MSVSLWSDIQTINSSDENVKKFVFKKDDAVAEAVLYKYPTYEDRTVICCSTQSGCPVGCRFCGAGDHFVRSFKAQEIVDQPRHLIEHTGVKAEDMGRLQIMFMSMGEPFYNSKELSIAMTELHGLYPNAALLISTSAPDVSISKYVEIIELASVIQTIGLQFSVHESTDEARQKLIPSKTCSLERIAMLGTMFFGMTGRKPFFNYCVHEKNNSDTDVMRLKSLFDPKVWECTISVICEREESIAAANERQRQLAQEFSGKMLNEGYNVRVFNPAGQDDIGGGCGQLWFVQDWMRRHPNLVKKTKGHGLPVVHTPTEHSVATPAD